MCVSRSSSALMRGGLIATVSTVCADCKVLSAKDYSCVIFFHVFEEDDQRTVVLCKLHLCQASCCCAAQPHHSSKSRVVLAGNVCSWWSLRCWSCYLRRFRFVSIQTALCWRADRYNGCLQCLSSALVLIMLDKEGFVHKSCFEIVQDTLTD